jgi:hypothetical protein
MAELKQIMDNNTTVLSQVVQRTSHFRAGRASRAPQSIFDMSFATQSIHYGDGGSVISSTLFSFDDEIVNSQAYRRALAKAYANSNDEGQTQSAGSNHGADSVADRVLTSAQQSSDPGRGGDPGLSLRLPGAGDTQSGSTLNPTNTELDNEATRLSETRSLTVSDTPVLSPTPSDPLMAFMFEKQTYEKDWATVWAIERTDIEGVRKIEVDRQHFFQEIITSESRYLRSLQVLRYLYKYRLVLDLPMTELAGHSHNLSFISRNFPGCEDIYHANKTLLYDPLKSRQSSEGPWLSTLWDIFQNWLKQSGDFYIEYASLYPKVNYAVRKEAKQNARFSRFLDQSREHRLSERLVWDYYLKSPLTRLQRYCQLLQAVLRGSDRSDPRHKCGELEQLIEDMRGFVARCDVAIKQSSEEVEIDDLRSRMGDAEQRILPDDTEIQLTQMVIYRESRFRDIADAMILVIRKPDRFVVVLKEVSRPKAISESSLEVLAEVSVPGPPHKMHNLNEHAASGQHLCLY